MRNIRSGDRNLTSPIYRMPRKRDVEWAYRTISDIAGGHGGVMWLTSRDINAVSDGSDIETWAARIGTSPTQAATSKQPEFAAFGWAGVPVASFDNVGEALVSSNLDLSGTDKVCVMLSIDHPAGKLSTAVEHGLFTSALATGWAIYYYNLANQMRIYFAGGSSTDRETNVWYGEGDGRHVYVFTMDSSLPSGSQIRGWKDGVEITPTTVAVLGTSMVGNFTLADLYVGAAPDGGGGLTRPAISDIQQLLVLTSIPSDAEILELSTAGMYLAGLV